MLLNQAGLFYSPSSFKLQRCWLFSCARITDSCQLIGTFSLAALLHLEIFRRMVAHLSILIVQKISV
ncbi:hypothetical protein CRN74_12680 [Yersinia frederiksenii]|nr:hypothetical protein CRN74_12680 [Yersinia frederiksenii]